MCGLILPYFLILLYSFPNTRRIHSLRLYGKKETGANVEFVLIKNLEGDVWEAMVRPGNKLHVGAKVVFGDGLLTPNLLLTDQSDSEKMS